jgi:predicted ATPase
MGTDRVLVGRDAQVEALETFLRGDPVTRPPVLLVAGEAGIGKTALVEQVLAGGEQRSCAAGPPAGNRPGTRCWHRSSGPPPGAGLRRRPPGFPATGRRGAGRELALVLPELGPPPAQASRSALAAAMCSVLSGVAGSGRLAVFLDDLQWADEATLDLLPALADALSGGPVSLIGCYRSDEMPRDHRLRTVRAELRRARRLAEIDLAPLPDACVAVILAALLGPSHGLSW